jgi:serine/threonine-protein kinase PRP4
VQIDEAKRQVRICDLGSALYQSDMQPTPYLVSRFYRAPEISTYSPGKHGVD